MRRAAAGMPTSSSKPIARLRASASLIGRCVRIVSTSWRPTVYSGLSEVSGSWNTAPISRPRTVRIASYGRLSMRRPASRISPAAMRPGGSMSPMIAAPVSDLPAPDSPTTPSTSPGAMVNETSWTATSVPRRVGNSTRRPSTASSGSAARRDALRRGYFAAGTVQPAIGSTKSIDGRPLLRDRVRELRVDVVALAGLDVEHHHVQRRAAGPPRRRALHDEAALARLDADEVRVRERAAGRRRGR